MILLERQVAFDGTSDEELARQTQAGFLSAFDELVGRYERRVLSFVWQICRNEGNALEITQDSFVRAFQAIAQYDSRHPFRAWLFTIARRKAIDFYRSQSRIADEEPPEQVDDLTPADVLARRDDERNAWAVARRKLKQSWYEALWLCYAEDLEVPEIARVMGRTRPYVKVVLHRARRILARELGGMPGGAVARAASGAGRIGVPEPQQARNG